jgi:hypothetical protein
VRARPGCALILAVLAMFVGANVHAQTLPSTDATKAAVDAVIADVVATGQAMGSFGEGVTVPPDKLDAFEAAIAAAQAKVESLGLVGCWEAYGDTIDTGLELLAMGVKAIRTGDDPGASALIGAGAALVTGVAETVYQRQGCVAYDPKTMAML